MAGENIRAFGTKKALEANGASIASAAIGVADDATYSTATDGGSYPDAEFTLSFTFATAPTEGGTLAVFARPLNLVGTNDAEVPEASRPGRWIGSVTVNNVTTTQYDGFFAYDLPREASYYLLNTGTGQTLSAGWTLDVEPMTRTAAP